MTDHRQSHAVIHLENFSGGFLVKQAYANKGTQENPAVRRALEKTPPELVADIATNGLLLAGGGALLKGLDQLITQQSSLMVHIDDDPLTTVVRGTGRSMEDEATFSKVYIN